MYGKASQSLDNVSPQKSVVTSKGFNNLSGNVSEKSTTLSCSSKEAQAVSTTTLPVGFPYR
jgi:hypothetical protein